MVCTSQKEFRQIYPKPGWVEHDPLEIWSSQAATLAEVMAQASVPFAEVAAIGITNQRETTLVWDKATGKPVYNAIVWQDRRTADDCARLKEEGLEAKFTAKTGLRLDPYFSGTKLRWILNQVDGVRARAERGELLFGTVDSWLIWKLTGGKVHATDVTNAGRTLLCNIHTGEWDNELLEILGVPCAMLPEIKSCSEVYGHTDAGIPIAGVAGDQHAALFGQACFTPGMAKNTYGTGCFLLMQTGTKAAPSTHNLLTTPAWKLNGVTEYALEGSIFIGGAVVQWLRDELQIVRTSQECDELAASVADAHGVYLVPAFAGLGAPHWDPYARGSLSGITRGFNRAHLCRAALESIAFQSADLIQCMEADSGLRVKELRVDGGATRSNPMLQFQADLLQGPVVRPRCYETTALGAAYFAGLAVGFWNDKAEISRRWEADQVFRPARPAEEMRRLSEGWRKAVTRAQGWVERGADAGE